MATGAPDRFVAVFGVLLGRITRLTDATSLYSIAAVMEKNPALAAAVDKVVLNYVPDAQSDTVGASFVKCTITGKQLDITIEIASMNKVMDASWQFGAKLALLANAAPAVAAPAATAAPAAGVAKVAAPVGAPAKVGGAPTPAPSAAAPRLIPATKPAEKITPSSGKATYLYMTLGKAQTALKTPTEPALVAAFGKTVAVEIDWKFVDLVDFYGYATQDNQKLIINEKVVPALKDVVMAAQDSIVSVASTEKATFASKVSKIVFKYAAGVAGGVSAALAGTNLEISFDLDLVEQPKSPSWGIAARVVAALKGVAPTGVASVIVEPPLVKQVGSPSSSSAPVAAAPVAAAPVASAGASAAAPAGARVKRAKVGGAPGGKGKFTFLYTSLENAKKKVASEVTPAFTAMCQQALGKPLAFDVDWEGLINDENFCRESQADQKTMLTQSVVDNVRAVMTSPNVIPALFKSAAKEGGAFAEHLGKVTRIRWVYEPKDFIVSKHGVKFAEFNLVDKTPSDFEIRVNVGAIDDIIDPDNFAVVEKLYEAMSTADHREEIEAERFRAAEEEKMRRAEEERIMAEEAQRRNDAERRKKAEEEEKRVRLEAEKGKEERQAVIAPLRPLLDAFTKRICAAMGISAFSLDIDDFFVHDRRLRFKEINYKETLLKNMSSDKSVFSYITQAIEQISKIPLAKTAFVAKITKILLRCIPTCPSPYPDVNLHDDTKILYMDCTFSHLFDHLKWNTPTVSFRESEIVEIYKAELLHDLGCEVEAAQWESSIRCQEAFDKKILPALTGDASKNKIQCVVQWESMAPTITMARNDGWLPIRLLLSHYVLAESVLDKISTGAEGLNLVVKKIILRDVKQLVLRFGTNSGIDLDPTKNLLEITLNFLKLPVEIPSMRGWFIEKCHSAAIAKCVGITVKTVAAEMAIQNAEPQLNTANASLKSNGFPAVTVSWAEFVDSKEFTELFADLGTKTPYGVISGPFAGTLSNMANGFFLVTKTQLGQKFAPNVKVIRVTVDPKTPQFDRLRPQLSWNDKTGEFVAKFGIRQLTVPEGYNWRAQLEKIFGILLDTIRMELASQKTNVINTMLADFGKNIPVNFDEAFTKTPQFNALDPEEMDQIMRPFITKLPASLFHTVQGIAKITQLPPGKQTAHEKITSIRLALEHSMGNSFKVELKSGELLVSCGYGFAQAGYQSVEPIGYKVITDVLNIRSNLEQFIVAECVPKIQKLQKDIETAAKISSLPLTMDWKNLIENAKFAKEHDFVTMMRHVPEILSVLVHKKDKKNRWNEGITVYCAGSSFASSLGKSAKSIVFRTDYSGQADGSKHGRFPDRATQGDLNNGVLMITTNFTTNEVYGCGAHVEHLVYPSEAKQSEQEWISTVADQLQEAEENRRARLIADTHSHNESEQSRYESETTRFQKEQIEYAKNQTKPCTSCRGKGWWGTKLDCKCLSCGTTGLEYGKRKQKEPRPPRAPERRAIPSFPSITSINFKGQATRETLQQFN